MQVRYLFKRPHGWTTDERARCFIDTESHSRSLRKWISPTRNLCALFALLAGSLCVSFGQTDQINSLQPAVPNQNPGPEYADSTRIFQGIPALERAKNGRLWAGWYAGGPDEPGEGGGNYVMLVTSEDDGRNWSGPALVIDPPGAVRAFDPALWIDPKGRLWLFWAQSFDWWDGRAGVWCIVTDDPGTAKPRWSTPRRLCDGIMMNKPTVLKDGSWVLPASVWPIKPSPRARSTPLDVIGDNVGAKAVVSRDQGKSFEIAGQTRTPQGIHDEHMFVERLDGSLWVLLRTRVGMAESLSPDGGKHWGPCLPSNIPHINARFFIRRLASGHLLLVRHNPADKKTRSDLTAYLSKDDGKSWIGGLLIDKRTAVSYPDGVQDENGVIRIIYDYQRTKDKQILMAVFSEEDVVRGAPSPSTRLRVVINQATGKPSRP